MEMNEISKLAALLRQQGDKILCGNFHLSITTTVLQCLNAAFRMSVEHDANSSFQVIHTTNSKLHELHFLHDFVQKVKALVITHGASTLKGNVDISKFLRLRYLELRRIPMHMLTGLNLIQSRLQIVIVAQSLSRPMDLLGDELAWSELTKLHLPQNTLCSLDSSLRLAIALKEVDLSHNQLSDAAELEFLPNLTVLNLSYNRLQTVPQLHRNVARTLKVLSLAHNQLENITGLETLTAVQNVNIGWNCLVESSSLAPLSYLPNLQQLILWGNPVSHNLHYREQTAKHLHPCIGSATKFCLNGSTLNEQETRWVGAACLGTTATFLPCASRGQDAVYKGTKVREVVIADLEDAASLSVNIPTSSHLGESRNHLETKRQIESLREKLGDSWLGGVPELLGLPDEAPSASNHEAQAWLESQHRPAVLDLETTEQYEQEPPPPELPSPPALDESLVQQVDTVLDYEDGEEGCEAPFLVQRQIVQASGEKVAKDLFFIIGPSTLVEREVAGTSKVVTQWAIESLQSCEHAALNIVKLSFDTVRKDKQQREYVLEDGEVQRLCRKLSSYLEARTLMDMNQLAYQCMKCSTEFTSEGSGPAARCPNCGSAIVVQDDSLEHSDLGAICKVVVSAEVHPTAFSKKSLDLRDARRTEGADSDIEVLSNPSQSSIEVLTAPLDDTHSREQSVDPSNEENCKQAVTGLTESSSSGSMTDSVCTAYESATVLPPSLTAGVLGCFLQTAAPSTGQAAGQQHIVYSYSDFTRVDHRLKLHLCMHLFTAEDEILTALLRCWVIGLSTTTPHSCLLVLTSRAVYVLRVTGPEGDNPGSWLAVEGTWPLGQLATVSPVLWQHGVQFAFNSSAHQYVFLLGDPRHAAGFLKHISTLVPVAAAPDAECLPAVEGESPSHLAVVSSATASCKSECKHSFGPAFVAVSNSHVAVGNDVSSGKVFTMSKPITSLMEVDRSSVAPWILRLRFLEEVAQAEEDEWGLSFVSRKAQTSTLEALQLPWQKYFEVPLDVRIV